MGFLQPLLALFFYCIWLVSLCFQSNHSRRLWLCLFPKSRPLSYSISFTIFLRGTCGLWNVLSYVIPWNSGHDLCFFNAAFESIFLASKGMFHLISISLSKGFLALLLYHLQGIPPLWVGHAIASFSMWCYKLLVHHALLVLVDTMFNSAQVWLIDFLINKGYNQALLALCRASCWPFF